VARWAPGSSSNLLQASRPSLPRLPGLRSAKELPQYQEERASVVATAPSFPPARHGPYDRESVNANPSAILAISFPVRSLDDLAPGTGNCPVTSSDGSCHETWRGKPTDAVHLCADLGRLAPTHSNLQPGCCYVARSTDAAYTAAQRRPDGTVPRVPWPYSVITTGGGPLPWSMCIYQASIKQPQPQQTPSFPTIGRAAVTSHSRTLVLVFMQGAISSILPLFIAGHGQGMARRSTDRFVSYGGEYR
jgi:hypothetical protein